MFNVLLDAFPDNFEGYLIRTDFRIGVQIALAANDDSLTDGEKVAVALRLLYGAGAPRDINLALKGISWFMSGGENAPQGGSIEEDDEDGDESESSEDSFDFGYDAMRLQTAFRKTYGIDLNKAKLHWFEFRALLSDLGECAFTSVVEYRTKDLNGLPQKQRNEYAKLKRKYALPRRLSDEEAEKVQSFMNALSIAK